MKKSLLTFLGLLMVLSSFGQSYQQVGNTLQRRIAGSDTSFRFSLGVTPGFMYLYTKPQVDSKISVINNNISIKIDSANNIYNPIGLKNQQPFITADGSRISYISDQIAIGQFIKTDDELARAISRGTASQADIFNNFNRFSHGTTPVNPAIVVPSNNIPGNPSHTNSWSFDTVTNRVKSTLNAGDALGFFSREKYKTYSHTVTLSSTASDNDFIGVVIAFVEDANNLVTNYAYGLNPNDFNWPIDVTSPTIPNQHSLTVYRNRNNVTQTYKVIYDKGKLSEKVIANGSSQPGLFNTTDGWLGNSVDVKIVASSDTIMIYTSQFSDAPGGKGALGFPIVINLNSDPDLLKFKGAKSYGYAVQSQEDASYSNISFSETSNVIYDLRNGDVYVWTGNEYSIDAGRNFYTEIGLGIMRMVYNPFEDNLMYVSRLGVIQTLNKPKLTDSSLILTAPNGTHYKITVNNSGALISTAQ